METPKAWLFEPEDFAMLREVEARLYHFRDLSGDERRDLANRMNAIMGKAIPYNLED